MAQYYSDFRSCLARGTPHGFTAYGSGVTYHGKSPGLQREVTASGFDGDRRLTLTGVTAADAVGLLLFRQIWMGSATNYSGAGVGFFLRQTGGNPASLGNAYFVGCGENNSRYITAYKYNGSYTALFSNSLGLPETPVSGTGWYWLKAEVVGTTIREKCWKFGDVEPATWAIAATDSGISGAGYMGIRIPGERSIYEIAYAAFGTDGDDAPAAPSSFSVGGTVYDENNVPVQRKVRVYHRSTGALLGETNSSAVNGGYSLSLTSGGEVQRIVIDDASADPLLNDIIDRVLPG